MLEARAVHLVDEVDGAPLDEWIRHSPRCGTLGEFERRPECEMLAIGRGGGHGQSGKVLYDEEQQETESYFGNVEGHDVVDHEIRIFLSAPDCDRLVSRLMPTLRSLPWSGKFHVVKRRGEFMDDNATEECVLVV
jgi:hypothetical protein